MNPNTQNGAELGIMMTARDDVLNERLGSISDNAP